MTAPARIRLLLLVLAAVAAGLTVSLVLRHGSDVASRDGAIAARSGTPVRIYADGSRDVVLGRNARGCEIHFVDAERPPSLGDSFHYVDCGSERAPFVAPDRPRRSTGDVPSFVGQ